MGEVEKSQPCDKAFFVDLTEFSVKRVCEFLETSQEQTATQAATSMYGRIQMLNLLLAQEVPSIEKIRVLVNELTPNIIHNNTLVERFRIILKNPEHYPINRKWRQANFFHPGLLDEDVSHLGEVSLVPPEQLPLF